MRKPSFGVTASALVLLTALGFFRVIYEPQLPASSTEYLVTVPSSSSIPAPIVEINWKRSIEEGQAEAKRRKTGLLILLIDPSSSYSKDLELKAFRDAEVSRYVNRNFVPVKINLDQFPEWGQSVLPVQRLGHMVETGFDLVVADTDGKLLDRLNVDSPFQYLGVDAILPFLIEGHKNFGQGSVEQIAQTQQSNDFQALALSSPEALPDFRTFMTGVKEELKFQSPGVFSGLSTRFRPATIRVLAKTGDANSAIEITKELALSPLYDPIDGGFFREARISGLTSIIDTSKSSAQNALGAEVIAQLSCLSNNANLRSLAIDISNEVMTEFSEGDSLCTSRLNDEGPDQRSRRSSLNQGKLGSIFSPAQEKAYLSFVSQDRGNDQNLGSLLNMEALGSKDFQTLRQIMRQKIEFAPPLSEPDHIAVNGYIAARLFDVYRFTGDQRFLNKAKLIAEQVYAAQSENTIARIYGNRQLGPGWLGTYLGVADCGLANYAATGEIYPLRNGAEAMKLALNLFKDPKTGLLVNTPETASPTFAFTSEVPDLADRGRESFMAQALRLAYHYSVIAEDLDMRANFATFVQGIMVRLNGIMNHASSTASGYFDASFDIIQNKAIIASGPNRVDESVALAKKYPLLPIYPLSLANKDRKLCFYIQEGTVMQGPFTEEDVHKKLKEAGLPYPR